MKGRIKQTEYFPALTGLRAVAVVLIFISHFVVQLFGPTGILRQIGLEFHIGVSIFLVLSGFLLTYKYYPLHLVGKNWYGTFLVKRFARTYPIFLILTAISLWLVRAPDIVWWINLTLTKGLFAGLKFSGVAPAWVLTVEWSFYLLLPLIFTFYRKFKFWQVPAWWVVGIAMVGLGKMFPWGGFFATFPFMWLYTFFGRVFDFAVGMFIAQVLLKNGVILKERNTSYTYLGLSGIALCVGILVWCQHLMSGDLGIFHPYGMVVNNLLLPMCVGTLLWGLMSEKTWVRRILESRLLTEMGLASYVFFLLHYAPANFALGELVHYNVYPFFVMLWIVSWLMYRFIEKPLNSLVLRLAEG